MVSQNSTTSSKTKGGGSAKEAAADQQGSEKTDSGRSHKEELDSRFGLLNLREDEEEDVVLEEDLEELQADAEFLALARVHTTSNFSHAALFDKMRAAWNLAQDVEFRAINDGMFAAQLIACVIGRGSCRRDPGSLGIALCFLPNMMAGLMWIL